uniref:Uncharacterized protein n=1 Tax=Tanacetum cinerariifolium TaxID=118510 RepID=A0A6L2JKZ6_TANCI|nr:hypothetical protein [Tanacetum cinerariifolium]
MHKAFPLPGESFHWQYKFPLPVKVVPTARRLEMPLPGVYTAIEEMMKKLPSSALPTIADEPASPVRDVSEREDCPTESGFIVDQDRATFAKSSTLPYDSEPRVTSPAADEGRRSINEGEAAAERISNNSEDITRVLTSMDAATVLAGGIDVPTGSSSIPTAGPLATVISIGSEVGPTASPIVGPTASPIVTSYSRRKWKEVMVESDTPKKQRLQEQIDAQVTRDLEEQQEREDMRMNEQITRDAEVARIHAEEELQGMIDRLDKSNETIAKYLQEYQDFASELPLEKRIELISDLVKYQENYSKVEDFIPIGSKEEAERLVPVEDVYVQALQVKHPIIDWKVHTERQRSYWMIIRLGGSSACYQFFIDLLKQLDREDLNQLWALVNEYLSIRPATSEKEMELWVELKRLYEPDPEDQLWTQTQNFMHAPVEWKLYNLSRVHHVTAKDKEIFMLVEKDYPLRKEHNTDFHQIVDFLEASHIRHLKLNDEEGISSLPDAELFENLSLMGYNILLNQRTVPLFASMIVTQGEGLANPTEPHHTPSPQEHQSPQSDYLPQYDSPPLLHQTIIPELIPHDLQAPTETLTPRRLTKRAIQIAKSKALSPVVDEHASLLRDDRHREAFLIVSSLDAGKDGENITKTPAMSHESSPRVPSLDADDGNQDIEISRLKARVKSLKDKESKREEPIQEDDPITGGIIDIGEELGADKSTAKGSNDTEEMVNVLSSMDAVNILSSGGTTFSTTNVSLADVFPTAGVPTVSGSFPNVAREMEEEFARENQRLSEQASNEVIAKHLSEYAQAKADLSVGEKIELISELVTYQDYLAEILKYQAQQSKPSSKKEQRRFYMSVLKSHAGWNTKHFRGMTLEQIKEKFIPVWKLLLDFIPMSSKKESEKVLRPGIKLDQGSLKRVKISHTSRSEPL